MGGVMIHKVREWMSNPVIIVDKDSSVSYALTLMRRRNIHSLVVQIDQMAKEYGIITTTDIRDKIIAKEKNPSETAIGDIMTQNLITASPDWNLKECSIIMQANNINHLPVLDENRYLIGLISATDLFIAAEEIGWESG
jgi:acetoin utilization protein AcuB/CBS domain-containing protein